jgi:K+-sensing histidine kinase KdpD
MKRFAAKTHPALYWAIGISIAAVFLLDMQTPIGIATWILYLVPLMLCFRVSEAWLPAVVASVCTVLLVVDWFISAPGIAEQIAQFNRALGIVVMWCAAMLARNSLIVRRRLQRDEWLGAARTRIADAVAGEQSVQRL